MIGGLKKKSYVYDRWMFTAAYLYCLQEEDLHGWQP